MDIFEAVKEALKVMVLPELALMKEQIARLGGQLDVTNNRISDIYDSQVYLNKRVDHLVETFDTKLGELRRELLAVTDRLDAKIDDLRRELLAVKDGLDTRIDEVRRELVARQDGLDAKLDEVRRELLARQDGLDVKFDELRREVDAKIDRVHGRLDQLCILMIKPDEFSVVRQRLDRLENDMHQLKRASGL